MASLGSFCMLVFNALCLIKNDPVENGLSRIQKGKFGCNSSIVKIDVAVRVVFHEFVEAFQLLSYCAICSQYNVKFQEIIGCRLFVMIYKHG